MLRPGGGLSNNCLLIGKVTFRNFRNRKTVEEICILSGSHTVISDFIGKKKVSVLVTIVINTTTKSNIKEESILAYGSRRLEVHNSEKRTAAGTGS